MLNARQPLEDVRADVSLYTRYRQCSIGKHGSPARSFIVHGRAGQQEIGDIGDVHPQLQVAIGQGANVQRIVYVLAPRGVHTADRQAP